MFVLHQYIPIIGTGEACRNYKGNEKEKTIERWFFML